VTTRAELNAFQEKLRQLIRDFERDEPIHRAQWIKDGRSAVEQDELLERVTRRFLIDPLLTALDWSPADPALITEERRSWADTGERLFFDYLGVDEAQNPLLLVEAKAFDSPPPRAPHSPEPNAETVCRFVAEAIDALNTGASGKGLLKIWMTWLKDLRTYVRSLPPQAQATLQRVVITSGHWIIVIENPGAVFSGASDVQMTLIHAFRGFDDMVANAAVIYALLHRARLADTLPLKLSLPEAVALINRESVTHLARGSVVITRRDGPANSKYVRRTVAPAVFVVSGGRAFAITEVDSKPLPEPHDSVALGSFLGTLSERGEALEAAVRRQHSLALPLTRLSEFPPFALAPPAMPVAAPASGSTASRPNRAAASLPVFARTITHRDEPNEHLVVCGEQWFYKFAEAAGPECVLHDWLVAQANNSAIAQRQQDPTLTSFTVSGDAQHCADAPMKGHRLRVDCHIEALENHLCCRACVFDGLCWTPADRGRHSCPLPPVS
jgi:hypothetical protein